MKAVPRLREGVVRPGRILADADEAGTPEICEMPRGRGLRNPEHGHQVAHAHLSALQQMENAQPRPI